VPDTQRITPLEAGRERLTPRTCLHCPIALLHCCDLSVHEEQHGLSTSSDNEEATIDKHDSPASPIHQVDDAHWRGINLHARGAPKTIMFTYARCRCQCLFKPVSLKSYEWNLTKKRIY